MNFKFSKKEDALEFISDIDDSSIIFTEVEEEYVSSEDIQSSKKYLVMIFDET